MNLENVSVFLLGFSLLLVLSLRWLLINRYMKRLINNRNLSNHPDVSIVIPLKGWDASLPNLINNLGRQRYQGSIEVLVVTDDPERLNNDSLPKNVHFLQSALCPPDWQDKNWRLNQGVVRSRFSTHMFLDSDTHVDQEFLARRLASHVTALSFSIPLYVKASTQAAKFLSAFTNYSNLSLYGLGFALNPEGLPTAIGPCVVSSIPAMKITECLKLASQRQAAVDHALAHHVVEQGYSVGMVAEPIRVIGNTSSWSEVLGQIMRWLMLWRTARRLIDGKLIALIVLSSSINASALWMILLGIFVTSSAVTAWLFISLVLSIFLVDSLGLLWLEHRLLKRGTQKQWAHLVYLPITQIALPILFIVSLFRRKFTWRGKTIKMS